MSKRYKARRRQRRDESKVTDFILGMLADASAKGEPEATEILERWQGAEGAAYARYLVRGPKALLAA